ALPCVGHHDDSALPVRREAYVVAGSQGLRSRTGIVARAQADYGRGMRNRISGIMVALVFGGALAAGTLTSCDDNSNNASTGTAGTGGSSARGGAGGTAARGGSGGTGTAGAGGTSANMSVYNMQLSGSQE